MINEIAVCLTYTSNGYLLMSIAVVFYVFSKRVEHAHLVILLLFAMMYNSLLKELLKIPAPVTSPTRYGFPSGHMNFATMFFGWFMLIYKTKLLYLICPIALASASMGMIYLGYHDICEVALTPLLPICVLTVYNIYLRKVNLNDFILIFIIISSLCQFISFFMLDIIPMVGIIGSYGILGFGIGSLVLSHRLRMIMVLVLASLIFFTLSDDIIQFSKNCVWLIAFGSLPFILKMIVAIRQKFSL